MMIRKWMAVTLLASAGVGVAVLRTSAQNPIPAQPAQPIPAQPAAESEPTTADDDSPDLFADLKDLGFSRYVDVEQLGAAWVDLDASLMTDFALQLAEGERVLMRNHTGGLTAQKLFGLAHKIAAEKRQKPALERLKQVATARKDADLLAKVEATAKLIEKARPSNPGAAVSVEDATPEEFAAFQDAADRITRHKLLGDAAAAKEFSEQLKDVTGFSKSQTEYLTVLAQDAAEATRSGDDADPMTDVLRKLSAATRGNESNRDQVRARVAAGGWTVLWGVNIDEAEYAKFVVAIASAVASGNPGPVVKYISDYAERTFVKVKAAFPGAVKSAVVNFILRALKSGGSQTNFGKMGVKAGLATYQRWYTVSVKVPDGTEKYKIKGPWGTWTWGYRVKYKTVTKNVPLPNHHTPYVAFRL